MSLDFRKAKAPDARCQAWIASGVNYIHLIIELPTGGYMFRVYDVKDMSEPVHIGIEGTRGEAARVCNKHDKSWEEPS
jgi:hypothetical protein